MKLKGSFYRLRDGTIGRIDQETTTCFKGVIINKDTEDVKEHSWSKITLKSTSNHLKDCMHVEKKLDPTYDERR